MNADPTPTEFDRMPLGWAYAAWAATCAFVVTVPWMHPNAALLVSFGAFIAARFAASKSRRAGDSDHGFAAAVRTVTYFAGLFPLTGATTAFAVALWRGDSLSQAFYLAGGFLLMGALAAVVAALLSLPVAMGATHLFAKGARAWLGRNKSGETSRSLDRNLAP